MSRKTRLCKMCSKEFIPNGSTHFYCGNVKDKISCSYKHKIEYFRTSPNMKKYLTEYENRPEIKEYRKKWKKERRIKLRQIIFDHYGWKCACPKCPEIRPEFMTIDHINGRGSEHLREIGISKLYSWLIENNFPPEYQTLCWNCNHGKYLYGKCPHAILSS